jgi:predicted nucleic acid-binding protein
MTALVADTSALVSLGVVTETNLDPLELCLTEYEVTVPSEVEAELAEIAADDDRHGRGATTVQNRLTEITVESVSLDTTFPLEDGENGAVTLANEIDAALLLCDEFTQLGLIHASLADTRLVTTPTLLSIFQREGLVSTTDALSTLDEITDARSWEQNSYVQRARSLLES